MEIHGAQLPILNAAGKRARGFRHDFVSRRPGQCEGFRESGGHEYRMRDREQLAGCRFMREGVTVGKGHRQRMEGETVSLDARSAVWWVGEPGNRSSPNNLLLLIVK